jgi:hypothetical protein
MVIDKDHTLFVVNMILKKFHALLIGMATCRTIELADVSHVATCK